MRLSKQFATAMVYIMFDNSNKSILHFPNESEVMFKTHVCIPVVFLSIFYQWNYRYSWNNQPSWFISLRGSRPKFQRFLLDFWLEKLWWFHGFLLRPWKIPKYRRENWWIGTLLDLDSLPGSLEEKKKLKEFPWDIH